MDTQLAPAEVKLGRYQSVRTHLLNLLTDSLTKLFILNLIETFDQIGIGD